MSESPNSYNKIIPKERSRKHIRPNKEGFYRGNKACGNSKTLVTTKLLQDLSDWLHERRHETDEIGMVATALQGWKPQEDILPGEYVSNSWSCHFQHSQVHKHFPKNAFWRVVGEFLKDRKEACSSGGAR